MASSQEETFADFEADSWFERNRDALSRFVPEADLPLRLLDLYEVRPRTVLEVGAANGARLAVIADRFGARAIGVELSTRAMEDGRARFPRVEFVRGAACAIPLEQRCDLIIVNFVFHWIDRINLFRSVAEVDRLLDDDGFLVIGDFHPSNFLKNRYHHLDRPAVYTFKQNYAAIFLASGLYELVSVMTSSHGARRLRADVAEDERIGATLLRKVRAGVYLAPPRS